MKKRILAGLTASVLAAACAAQIPSILSVSAAGSYDMQLKIQLDGEKKAISPYIYGVNESGNSGSLKSVKTNAVRQGGNRFTGYNWETNYSNAGEDWVNSSDTHMGDVSDGPAYQAHQLSKECTEQGIGKWQRSRWLDMLPLTKTERSQIQRLHLPAAGTRSHFRKTVRYQTHRI